MALINCKNCGHQISDKATVCPKCGTPVGLVEESHSSPNNEQNCEVMYMAAASCLEEGRLEEAQDYIAGLIATAPDNIRYQELQKKLEIAIAAAEEENEERAKKRKRTLGFITIILIVAALIGIGFWYYQKTSLENELTQWDQIKDTEEATLLENYLRLYPDGQFKVEAQQKLQYLNEKIALWNRVGKSDNEHELENFIQKYPEGYYHDLAVEAYDELLWYTATKENDIGAFRRYMEACPQGKHYREAKEKADYQEKVQMAEGEAEDVVSVLTQFLYAVGRGDENSMLGSLSSDMRSFMGKVGATKVDAIAYLRKTHADDVYSVEITIGETNVKKSLNTNGELEYTIDFTFDQRFSREDTSKETFASYKGSAIVNEQNKIKAISANKTAHY